MDDKSRSRIPTEIQSNCSKPLAEKADAAYLSELSSLRRAPTEALIKPANLFWMERAE